MKILTGAEMRAADEATTAEHGIPSMSLMENAGAAVARFVLEEFPEAQLGAMRIVALCGKGNNGGDGFVAARILAEAGCNVVLHEMRPVRGTDAHQTDSLAELVCSNSFRSDDWENNAVGLLHEEMRRAGSLILRAADASRLPAGWPPRMPNSWRGRSRASACRPCWCRKVATSATIWAATSCSFWLASRPGARKVRAPVTGVPTWHAPAPI